jgi:methionyl-tRNA synthetase
LASSKYYITTPIYYVNDLPHIGHIYTTVVADVIARYKRNRGFDVRFLTGTDEHGQNVERAAIRQGIPPKQLADRVVGRYHDLWKTLSITNDDFVRTTEPRHHAGVAAIIERIRASGDIYLDRHSGWYCSSCEAFYTEKELGESKLCPTHERPAEWHEEENLFFRLSAYGDRLLAYYHEHPEFIRPASRYNEVVRFVEGGLRDLSISRVTLKWGIPFPGNPSHVVYVWLDALTNYVSALGFGSPDGALYDRYWPADLHLVGKDILRFHCVYWPAFLMSAGLPLPRTVYGHGWWLRDEKKMSKSVGNVVRPDPLIAAFGPDALRYFLLREMNFGQDSNFSDEAFLQRYNGDLANGLGNAASRVLAMSRRYFGGRAPGERCTDGDLRAAAESIVSRYLAGMDDLELQRAFEAVWELIAAVDVHVNETAPWSIAKAEGTSSPRLGRVLYECLECLRLVAVMVEPVMPVTARRLLAQLGGHEAGGPAALRWGGIEPGAALGADDGALFPRADVEKYFSEATVDNRNDAPSPAAAPAAPEPTSTATPATPAAAPAAAQPVPAATPVEQVSIEEFARIKLVVGTVRLAERVPKSNKLVRMEVDLGEPAVRQIVAGIGKQYSPEQLVGRQIVVVSNLKSATLMGVESRGMVLAATLPDGAPVLLQTDREVPNGAGIK